MRPPRLGLVRAQEREVLSVVTRNRDKMEQRFGGLGDGAETLEIKGQTYTLWDLMNSLGLVTEDVQPVDAFHLADEGVYAVRYFDGQDRAVIAFEFDEDFRYLGEIRVHLAEYMGEDEYFEFPWNVGCPWTI